MNLARCTSLRTYTVSEGAYDWAANNYDNAVGGTVSKGNPYMWQEYGYRGEQFVPSQDGYILSRAEASRALSQSQGGSVTYSGPSADDIAMAVRDAILMAGVL